MPCRGCKAGAATPQLPAGQQGHTGVGAAGFELTVQSEQPRGAARAAPRWGSLPPAAAMAAPTQHQHPSSPGFSTRDCSDLSSLILPQGQDSPENTDPCCQPETRIIPGSPTTSWAPHTGNSKHFLFAVGFQGVNSCKLKQCFSHFVSYTKRKGRNLNLCVNNGIVPKHTHWNQLLFQSFGGSLP